MLYKYDGEEFWLGIRGISLLEFEVHSIETQTGTKTARGKLVFRDYYERINGSDKWIATREPEGPTTWKILPDRNSTFLVTKKGVQIFTLIKATNDAIADFATKILNDLVEA